VRASALQGIITDGNGSTVYNLNTVFGIVPTVIDFVLGTPATDVIGKCQQVWQSISSNLHGEVMRAVEAIVDPTFFGELIEHPNVAKYWLQAEQATSIANMVRSGITGTVYILQNQSRAAQAGSHVCMARISRIFISGFPHRATQPGNRRQPTFFEPGDHQAGDRD
jgi:Phage major capsid protein E